VLEPLGDALVPGLEREALLRALQAAVAGLVRESGEARDLAVQLEARLDELARPWA
jgi:hypothetical protein